jgi:hypothetical protein
MKWFRSQLGRPSLSNSLPHCLLFINLQTTDRTALPIFGNYKAYNYSMTSSYDSRYARFVHKQVPSDIYNNRACALSACVCTVCMLYFTSFINGPRAA